LGEYPNTIAAAAANFGVGWLKILAGGKCDDLTLQLPESSLIFRPPRPNF